MHTTARAGLEQKQEPEARSEYLTRVAEAEVLQPSPAASQHVSDQEAEPRLHPTLHMGACVLNDGLVTLPVTPHHLPQLELCPLFPLTTFPSGVGNSLPRVSVHALHGGPACPSTVFERCFPTLYLTA